MLATLFSAFILLFSLLAGPLQRSLITGPLLFTAGGLCLSLLPGQLVEVQAEHHVLLKLAEIGLVMTLFTDAARVDPGQLMAFRALPLRLLSAGMLLTLGLGALLAKLLLPQLSWAEAGILSAVLAPTDAGLGQSIVSSPRVPLRVRQSLNVEAGLNDGLAVPFMMLFIALATEGAQAPGAVLLQLMKEQIGYGTVIGMAIGWTGGWLLRQADRRAWTEHGSRPLGLLALPVFCITASHASGASMFIAAFVCGIALRLAFPDAGEHCLELTEAWGSLFNLFIFFLFGIFLTPLLSSFRGEHLLYAVLSLTVIRMAPVALALTGAGLSRASVLFMGWFGPRGLASIVLGLVCLEQTSSLQGEETMRLALMLTVLLSVLAHGLSAQPGIELYAKRLAGLPSEATEMLEN